MTTKPEHDTHEQPTAANYTAGDLPELPPAHPMVPRRNGDYELGYYAEDMQDYAREALCAAQQEQRDSLAASHREPSAQQSDEALAVTQRAIIEAAERRGYERGLLDAQPADKPAALRIAQALTAPVAQGGIVEHYLPPCSETAESVIEAILRVIDKPAGQAVSRSDAAPETDALPEGIWPEYLMIRDTGLHDDMGGLSGRIYTTAGNGYKKVKYVRADIAALSEAKGEQLRCEQHAPEPATAHKRFTKNSADYHNGLGKAHEENGINGIVEFHQKPGTAAATLLELESAMAGEPDNPTWRDISELHSNTDDLFWFMRWDGSWIVEGPREPQAGGYDADEWTHFAPCVSPPIADAEATPAAAVPDSGTTVEAVAKIEMRDGERYIDWLLEGGLDAVEPGETLCVIDATIPDDGLLVLAAPANRPADAPKPNIPLGCEMADDWAVVVSSGGQDLLTITHEGYCGIAELEPWESTIRGCAEHLVAFVGRPADAQRGVPPKIEPAEKWDEFGDGLCKRGNEGEHSLVCHQQYRLGWNDCRDWILAASPADISQPAVAHPLPVSEVYVDFPTTIGTCGPFEIIDGRITVPEVTVQDVIARARERAPASEVSP